MKKICLIGGTRPEAIKLAPLYFAFSQRSDCRVTFLSTGQHREMLDRTLDCFQIKPELDLNLMQREQTLPELSARVLTGVSVALSQIKPDAILVQGDTSTALFAAVAAFYQRIPIGHVEAGLRTYDLNAPWPEEMNRRLISPIARWSFTPTEASRANLLSEKVQPDSIEVTGNTVIDALMWMRRRQEEVTADRVARAIGRGVAREFAITFFGPGSGAHRWVLVTGHRRESFGSGMESVCRALRQLVDEDPKLGIVYPVHLNPNVREPVFRLLGNHPRIALIEPLNYEDFVWFMGQCYFVVTDSGGVQEEAPSLGKPVLVTRDTTERPEAVAAGVSLLVGTQSDRIVRESRILLDNAAVFAERSARSNPYGDGRASERIVNRVLSDLSVDTP